jgi:DNA mismatch endonuclease, patch repair protein
MTKEKNYIRDGRAPIPEKESTSRIMSAIKRKDTKPELILRKELWKNGLKGYRLNWKKLHGSPDIIFPGKKIAIFVNGCFWHRCPHCNPLIPKSHSGFWEIKFKRNTERDKINYNLLRNEGWKVFVIWECEIYAKVDNFVKIIKKVLSQ